MQRPTSVTVFGILNIVFAVFGFLGLLFSVAVFFIPGQEENPVLKVARDHAFYGVWMKGALGLGAIGCILLLLGGIGLLRLRPWGRTLSMAYAILTIVSGIAGMVINSVILLPVMMEKAEHSQGAEAGAAIGGAVGAIAGGCFGILYPIILLVFLLRRNFAAAFRPPAIPPPAPFV